MVSNSKPDDPELGVELSVCGSAETAPSSQSESAAFESPALLSSGSTRGSLDEPPLTQEELDEQVWNVAYVADLLDNKLSDEFGAQLYSEQVHANMRGA